jgi:hypothetical protein
MPIVLPDLITDVPSRADPANFTVRGDAAWAKLVPWSVQLRALAQALIDGLAAPISALAFTSSQRILGRVSAGAGPSEELTAAQVATLVQGDGIAATLCGFRGIPITSRSDDYTLTAGDAGKGSYHPSSDTTARVWTLPANAAVAWDVGMAHTFVNGASAGALTIAVTSDTLVMAGTGTTGSSTIAPGGLATVLKVAPTVWFISGPGVS